MSSFREKVKGNLYYEVDARRECVHAFFSDKPTDNSFHFYLYHDGQEKTILLIEKLLRRMIKNKAIPQSWFSSVDYIRVPFVVSSKNMPRLDKWIKAQS